MPLSGGGMLGVQQKREIKPAAAAQNSSSSGMAVKQYKAVYVLMILIFFIFIGI